MANSKKKSSGRTSRSKKSTPAARRRSTATRRTSALAAYSTPAPPTRSSTVEAKPSTRQVTQATIAEAAYFLWLRRGGDQTSNWIEAERMLTAEVAA